MGTGSSKEHVRFPPDSSLKPLAILGKRGDKFMILGKLEDICRGDDTKEQVRSWGIEISTAMTGITTENCDRKAAASLLTSVFKTKLERSSSSMYFFATKYSQVQRVTDVNGLLKLVESNFDYDNKVVDRCSKLYDMYDFIIITSVRTCKELCVIEGHGSAFQAVAKASAEAVFAGLPPPVTAEVNFSSKITFCGHWVPGNRQEGLIPISFEGRRIKYKRRMREFVSNEACGVDYDGDHSQPPEEINGSDYEEVRGMLFAGLDEDEWPEWAPPTDDDSISFKDHAMLPRHPEVPVVTL